MKQVSLDDHPYDRPEPKEVVSIFRSFTGPLRELVTSRHTGSLLPRVHVSVCAHRSCTFLRTLRRGVEGPRSSVPDPTSTRLLFRSVPRRHPDPLLWVGAVPFRVL